MAIMTLVDGKPSEVRLELDRDSIFFRCVEDSTDAIMISDRNGRLVYVNPSWQRTYGYSLSEALGETPRLLHSGVQEDTFYREMWSRITDPGVGHWKGELVNRAKDGTLVPVLLSITPFKGPDGDTLGFMGVAVDISWRKEMEAKVAHQDRLATIGVLASGLAHEIGTPLGVIRGRAEILQMQSENGVIRRNSDVILGQTDRISKIIQSLLKLSRGSEESAKIVPVPLKEMALEVIALMSGPIRDASVEARVEIEDGMRVQADTSRLEQILLNLVVNAVHAIEAGAKDRPEAPRKLTLHARPCTSCDPGNWVELVVEDSGCGIPPENLKRIFQPFFTTKEVGQGTGLGLAITTKLLQEMDGRIEVESELGRGTRFLIKLRTGH